MNPTLPPLDVKVNAQIQRFTTEINAPISGSRKTTAGISSRRFSCNSRVGDGWGGPHFQPDQRASKSEGSPRANPKDSSAEASQRSGLGGKLESSDSMYRRVRPLDGGFARFREFLTKP